VRNSHGETTLLRKIHGSPRDHRDGVESIALHRRIITFARSVDGGLVGVLRGSATVDVGDLARVMKVTCHGALLVALKVSNTFR
jgi:hypothetical protein